MIINAITDAPTRLVGAINKKFKEDKPLTWRIITNNGKTFFSHSPEQWDEKAMLKLTEHEDRVSFSVTWWKKDGEPDEETKDYILGRFVELLIVHFKDNFDRLVIS